MSAVLLDPRTGRPASEQAVDRALRELRGGQRGVDVPAHVRANLERAAELAGPFEPRASRQGWEELLYAPIADGAPVGTVTGASEPPVEIIFGGGRAPRTTQFPFFPTKQPEDKVTLPPLVLSGATATTTITAVAGTLTLTAPARDLDAEFARLLEDALVLCEA